MLEQICSYTFAKYSVWLPWHWVC